MTIRPQLAPPPSPSNLQVLEESGERLVIVIPAGGTQSRSIGCFALIWLIATAAFSALYASSDDKNWKPEPPPVWGMVLFLSLFWAVGIGMTVAWVRMRFTRLLLALEPSRLAIQREFLSKKNVSVLELDETSQAALESAYEENDRPVYRVCVTGVGREEKFGTGLSQPEKEWLVRTINGFLHRVAEAAAPRAIDEPTECPNCGAELHAEARQLVCAACGLTLAREFDSPADAPQPAFSFGAMSYRLSSRPPELAPADLPSDSNLSVDDSDPDCLKVSFVFVTNRFVKFGVSAFLGVFSLIWFGGLGTVVWDHIAKFQAGELQGLGLLFLIVPLAMCFSGLVPLLMCLAIWKGRVTISIDRDRFDPRLHVGPFGKSFGIATASILDVGIGTGERTAVDVPVRGQRKRSLSEWPVCVVLSTERSMPVGYSSDAELNEQLAGLIRYQLRQVGHELPHH